jgi:hypothetical protein
MTSEMPGRREMSMNSSKPPGDEIPVVFQASVGLVSALVSGIVE